MSVLLWMSLISSVTLHASLASIPLQSAPKSPGDNEADFYDRCDSPTELIKLPGKRRPNSTFCANPKMCMVQLNSLRRIWDATVPHNPFKLDPYIDIVIENYLERLRFINSIMRGVSHVKYAADNIEDPKFRLVLQAIRVTHALRRSECGSLCALDMVENIEQVTRDYSDIISRWCPDAGQAAKEYSRTSSTDAYARRHALQLHYFRLEMCITGGMRVDFQQMSTDSWDRLMVDVDSAAVEPTDTPSMFQQLFYTALLYRESANHYEFSQIVLSRLPLEYNSVQFFNISFEQSKRVLHGLETSLRMVDKFMATTDVYGWERYQLEKAVRVTEYKGHEAEVPFLPDAFISEAVYSDGSLNLIVPWWSLNAGCAVAADRPYTMCDHFVRATIAAGERVVECRDDFKCLVAALYVECEESCDFDFLFAFAQWRRASIGSAHSTDANMKGYIDLGCKPY